MNPTLLLAVALASTGLVTVLMALRPASSSDATDYLNALNDGAVSDGHPEDEYSLTLRQSFLRRVVRPMADQSVSKLSRLTPAGHTDRVRHDLLVAGLSGQVRADELVAGQIVGGGFGLLAAIAFITALNPTPGKAILAFVLLPAAGVLGPVAWLKRKADERRQAIFKDLPDALDLLAISVEAGVGFEGAIEVVCRNFDSALAEEFRHMLKEMELGLSRREALANLKRRTDVPELSNFVLALTQADALGMPIGRVLHTQAVELRNRRRQWAREKAGKLPVKILFPLVLFIFPAVLVVILGPAGFSIMKGFAN
ncbi:MAG TPA: type II secretion system F family protein [Acidimicrobiales bacterium]|nr:type II secretion system F family protein [Acidimicrobiales bacterium]